MAIAKEIQCTYCGLRGEIGRPGSRKPQGKRAFRHLGHNPLSGHLHYQCPACSIVLLIPPLDVLEGRSLQGATGARPQRASLQAMLTEILEPIKAFWKTFPHPWVPSRAGILSLRHPGAPFNRGGI